MKRVAEVNGGICGFQTRIEAACDDGQNVTFCITSGCEKVRKFADRLRQREPVDAYAELGAGLDDSIIAAATGCCCGCVVPAALLKAMQVSAGLALPCDATIRFCS